MITYSIEIINQPSNEGTKCYVCGAVALVILVADTIQPDTGYVDSNAFVR
jgi:hypothetical protein